ncbi:MAG: HD domain-containing protein [Deltaproteobacteria bacterium]|nr:HD domain-containing protein [Deltaproteobacteria bacterium]
MKHPSVSSAGENPQKALPTREQCFLLMARYGMLPNIREHSLLVTEVALRLGRGLIEAGLPLRLTLIEAGALLHDLGKTPCLGTAANHAEWGAQALAGEGYPEVAQVVREHVRLDDSMTDGRPLREAEVVNYADKRVLHTQVVTLAARFADLKERYGRTPEALARITENELKSRQLEQKIFSFLPRPHRDLLHLNHIRRQS